LGETKRKSYKAANANLFSGFGWHLS
jgi:hypothetical protein